MQKKARSRVSPKLEGPITVAIPEEEREREKNHGSIVWGTLKEFKLKQT